MNKGSECNRMGWRSFLILFAIVMAVVIAGTSLVLAEGPPLVVITPVEDELINNATYDVTGETDPLTQVDIEVNSTSNTRDYSLTSAGDGTFKATVELYEGFQWIVVTATDAMSNTTDVLVSVVLDTIPPEFSIQQPIGETMLTNEVQFVIVGTMGSEPDSDVFIGGEQVTHTGVFSHQVDLVEGVNIIEVKAVDEAGNEQVKVVTIVRDTIAPAMEVLTPEVDDFSPNDPTIKFTGTVLGSEGVVIVHKSIEFPTVLVSGTWEDGEWMFDLELGPADLEQDIEVIAFDLAENENITIFHVMLDIVPPSLNMEYLHMYTAQTTATIDGVTDGDIESILVNDEEVAIEDGDISITVDLVEGLNTFVI